MCRYAKKGGYGRDRYSSYKEKILIGGLIYVKESSNDFRYYIKKWGINHFAKVVRKISSHKKKLMHEQKILLLFFFIFNNFFIILFFLFASNKLFYVAKKKINSKKNSFLNKNCILKNTITF